jgi:hypothetical protein
MVLAGGCTSEYRPGETSDEAYQRQVKETQDMNNYILKPGWNITFH